MKKLFKFVSYAILSLLLLFIIATVILTNFINPNQYKPQIIAQVDTLTHRNLTINGNISLSFFPSIGLEVKNITLSNPQGTPGNLVSIEKIVIAVRPLPLLHRDIQVKEITLSGIDAHLIQNGNTNNWSNLVPTSGEQKPATNSKSSSGISLNNISGPIRINHVNIELTDKKTGQITSLSDINLTLNLNLQNFGDGSDLIKKLNITNSSAEVGAITLQKPSSLIRITDLHTDIKASSGLFTLAPITANLYGGKLKANAKLNLQSAAPRITMNDFTITGLDAGALAKSAAGLNNLSGTANISINKLTTEGTEKNALTQNLNADVHFDLNKGSYGLITLISDAVNLANAAKNISTGNSPSNSSGSGFSSITLNGDIVNGHMNNSLLTIESPIFNAKGTGEIDLTNKQTLNYNITTSKGIKIHITGTVTNPKVDMLSSVLNSAAKPLAEKAAGLLQNLLDH